MAEQQEQDFSKLSLEEKLTHKVGICLCLGNSFVCLYHDFVVIGRRGQFEWLHMSSNIQLMYAVSLSMCYTLSKIVNCTS